VPRAGDDGLSELAWMSGAWARSNETTLMEEYWSAPAAGTMLGVHRDVFEGGRAFFEFLRIERRGEDIIYFAMPSNQPPAEFRLTELGEQRAVFENPKHDFPQKIIYERKGDTLTATVEGIANGELRSSGWQWSRTKLD
jgi:hypothetical protein